VAGSRRTQRKVRVLRRAGFAAWHRLPTDFKPELHVPEHIHAVLLFDHDLSTGAGSQKRDYLAEPRLNGLLNRAHDNGPKVPVPASPTLVKQTVRRREILFMQTNDSVGYLQDVLGLTPDKFFGPAETQRFMKEQFGWNGRKRMSEGLFRKLFPVSVFELDAAIDPGVAAAVPRQRTTTAGQPTRV
jgi:hypothetical protein